MSINYVLNATPKHLGQGASLDLYKNSSQVRRFHQSFPQYQKTPLVFLPHLAEVLGLKNIYVKDESQRFGLNAFKVLGGSYAIGMYLAQRLNLSIDDLTYDFLRSPAIKAQLGEMVFVSATDGNHGRGVAWTAQQLGQKSVIFMPKGSDIIRKKNIEAHGATCTITDLNYDAAVRLASQYASDNNGILVQDTAWPGYEEIPSYIVQGYTTLGAEILEDLNPETLPTHVFLQAGVGSFAGAQLGLLAQALGKNCPKVIIVESDQADCIYKSAISGDGKPHTVTGDMNTLMAGLACGEPCSITWELLRDYATAFVSCPDYIAANGMRILAVPVKGDETIISGESGAVTTGLLHYIMQHPSGEQLKKNLELNQNSKVLLISTEGNTSPATFRGVVWFGTHQNE